ncbi:putative fas1 domain-containing protein [Phaeomoniella chlamydospora]|uniref:Putative fas1 domain-containing protein n=1 Tax=Phaeomoniella chlamydospora TaxID=158046 RepID=A0A0G2EGD6_PHACM|nr:putative fas1 domain-containing protein [Phaeomoniella chlamydospora]
MQPHLLLYSAILTTLIPTSVLASIKPQPPRNPAPPPPPPPNYNQAPLASPQLIDIMPPTPDSPSSSSIMISDVIGKTRSINIFAGFTRDISTVSSRLDDQSLNSTILCPLNSALQSLPRKPWEDPKDYDSLGSNAYAGDQGEDRAHRNLRRFVESYVVTDSPWREGEKVKTMGGQVVWWERRDGGKVVMPGEIAVEGVQEKVGNGEVWIVRGVVNYAE